MGAGLKVALGMKEMEGGLNQITQRKVRPCELSHPASN